MRSVDLPEFITGKRPKLKAKTDRKKPPPKRRGKGPIRANGDTGTPKLKQRMLEADLASMQPAELAEYKKSKGKTLKVGVAFEARTRSSTGHATEVGARIESQLPHDRYRNRGELDPTNSWRNGVLWEGAERLRKDFHASGLTARLCSSFEPRVASGSQQWEANKAVEALQRYKKAMNAVPATLRASVFYICIEGQSANDWASRNGMVPQAGLAILRLALAELAQFHG